MLWSWSIVVNGNGGLKMPHALTCARSQQKGSEARLDKKCDENVADTTAKRKTPQKTIPILRAQTIWTCYDSLQITMFYCHFFSAHWNCAEFREFLKLQCYKNMRICTFFCCSQEMFFFKVMQRHARKTVRRDVFAAHALHPSKKKRAPPHKVPSFQPRLQTAGTKPRTSM